MKYYLSALLFPFQKRLRFMTILGMFFSLTGFFNHLPYGSFVSLFGLLMGCYFIVYFMEIVKSSALNQEEWCELPIFRKPWQPYIYAISLFLFSYGPALFAIWMDWPHYIYLILTVGAVIYFPLAFLKLSITDDFYPSMPADWWRSVRSILPAYGKFVVFSLLILALLRLLDTLPAFIICRPLQFFILCVYMNILGKFYLRHKEAFEW